MPLFIMQTSIINPKEEVFQEMARSKFTAYTEFGIPAPASVAILKTIIPKEELWPPKPGTSWESHHAYNAWVGNTWLCEDIIEDYFGEGEVFFADLWMLNDHYNDIPGGKVTIKIVGDGISASILNWDYTSMKPNINQAGPTVRYKLPVWKTDRFKVLLEVEGHPEFNSEYTLAYQPRITGNKKSTPVMNQ